MLSAQNIRQQLEYNAFSLENIAYAQALAIMAIVEQLERLNKNLERVTSENAQIQVSAITSTWQEING